QRRAFVPREGQRGGPPPLRRRSPGSAGRWKTVPAPVTMVRMSSLRVFVILLLTVVLDLSFPVPQPHGATENVEEFEEVVHARQGRRLFRHVRDAVAPTVAREDRAR